MHEVVLRRYRKLLENGGPFPDLILIDGGKGQLSSAYAALQELGLGSLVAVGIAKKEELLFTRDREDAIALSSESPALLLIQRIRDEAHRFAVTFHRLSRTKRDLRSELDLIAGIGPRRRKLLLTTFGSVAGVRRATREELMKVVGAKSADARSRALRGASEVSRVRGGDGERGTTSTRRHGDAEALRCGSVVRRALRGVVGRSIAKTSRFENVPGLFSRCSCPPLRRANGRRTTAWSQRLLFSARLRASVLILSRVLRLLRPRAVRSSAHSNRTTA